MKITKLQKDLVLEMKSQGADKSTINGIMNMLETKVQQEQMMNYLISIRNQKVPKGVVIGKALEIMKQEVK